MYRPTCAFSGTSAQCFPHFHIRTPTENENGWQHKKEDELGSLQPEQWAKVLPITGPAQPEDERTNISACQMGISALFKTEAKKYRVQRSKWPWIFYFTSHLQMKTAVFLSSWPQRVKWVSNKMMDVKVLCLERKEIKTCGNRCYYFTLNSKMGLRH